MNLTPDDVIAILAGVIVVLLIIWWLGGLKFEL
jgi:hypothetical protein